MQFENHAVKILGQLVALLIKIARQKTTLTYQQVAHALEIKPPYMIHQTAELLEDLIRINAQADTAQLASLVVSRARTGLPAPGYFMLLNELGVYRGSVDGEDARYFHASEVQRCYQLDITITAEIFGITLVRSACTF